jgi:hypothetical protein
METLSDSELVKRLDHLDVQMHELHQKIDGIAAFIDEHRPALARGLSLMDPGAKLRDMLAGKKRARD